MILQRISIKRFTMLAFAAVMFVTAASVFRAPEVSAATTYMKYSWSPDVYRSVNGASAKYVTARAYAAAGSPSVKTVGWIPGSSVKRFMTNSHELFLYPPDDDSGVYSYHHLTSAEWNATGNKQPTGTVLIGFYKTPGSPDIYHVPKCGTTNQYWKVSYRQWNFYGTPTPVTANSIPSCI